MVATIPLNAFSTPTLTAQRQSAQFAEVHTKPINSFPRKDSDPQARPMNPTKSKLLKGQDNQLLPPIDAEFGLKATFGKCSAVEVIGPDGTCIPTPIPSGSSQPAP